MRIPVVMSVIPEDEPGWHICTWHATYTYVRGQRQVRLVVEDTESLSIVLYGILNKGWAGASDCSVAIRAIVKDARYLPYRWSPEFTSGFSERRTTPTPKLASLCAEIVITPHVFQPQRIEGYLRLSDRKWGLQSQDLCEAGSRTRRDTDVVG